MCRCGVKLTGFNSVHSAWTNIHILFYTIRVCFCWLEHCAISHLLLFLWVHVSVFLNVVFTLCKPECVCVCVSKLIFPRGTWQASLQCCTESTWNKYKQVDVFSLFCSITHTHTHSNTLLWYECDTVCVFVLLHVCSVVCCMCVCSLCTWQGWEKETQSWGVYSFVLLFCEISPERRLSARENHRWETERKHEKEERTEARDTLSQERKKKKDMLQEEACWVDVKAKKWERIEEDSWMKANELQKKGNVNEIKQS